MTFQPLMDWSLFLSNLFVIACFLVLIGMIVCIGLFGVKAYITRRV